MALALASGTRIGGFDLSDVIGRGGFGITYRAHQERTGHVYAIKEYLPEDFARRSRNGMVVARHGNGDIFARGLEAFLEEANILKELPKRPGLVKVRGAFRKFGTAYCVMEFIEGDSLERMARRMNDQAGRVPQDLLLDLARSILAALEELHAHQVIHRDVKPANIMIRRNGEPVLIDFGAARRISRHGRREAIFSRRYAAVEQFPQEQSGIDRPLEEGPWSDLYSLSVVLYELVAGELPPDAATRAMTVSAGRPDPFVPLSQRLEALGRCGDVDPRAIAAIDAGMGLMPSSRPPTARRFADHLGSDPKGKASRQAAVAPKDPDHRTIPWQGRQWPSPIPWILILAAVLGAAMIWYGRVSVQRL